MPEDKTTSRMPITPWAWIGLCGIVLISISSLISAAAWLLKILFGLGTSLLTASVVKHGIDFVDVIYDKKWLRKHIEVMASKRKNATEKYEAEDLKIEKSLQILSFSAVPVFKGLNNGEKLYDLLAGKKVDIQILIVDWRSPAAGQRAGEDNSGDVSTGMNVIKKHFKNIQKIYKDLDKGLKDMTNKMNIGKIEVRATKCNPYLTLYIRDEDTIVFGHYFSYCRGDENAALMIKKKWNPDIFNQYMSHFSKLWNQEERNWIFHIGASKDLTDLDSKINMKYFNVNI